MSEHDHFDTNNKLELSRSRSNSRTRIHLGQGLLPTGASLLTARRPSPTSGNVNVLPDLLEHPNGSAESPFVEQGRGLTDSMISEGLSTGTEDLGTFYQNLQIVMKDAVGDAVGNMSISPTSRDVVLAARKGLFIIDLDSPLAVPRFLPQGGTWNVADVHWNLHYSHQQYVASTSNEKLLIWNLQQTGRTAIEHVMHQHYRSITDINWHSSHPDLIATIGIDSWIWVWDIRAPSRATLGLCAFNPSGTQVKWNRVDEHILASSHYDEVVVWDRRNGSLPLLSYKAHSAKIYGIDWGRVSETHPLSTGSHRTLVTCSLDKTIKLWDLSDMDFETSDFARRNSFDLDSNRAQVLLSNSVKKAKHTIHTTYPAWKARNTPFGTGVLALPQRGETLLEMWAWPRDTTEHQLSMDGLGDDASLVGTFEGHTDIIKEYVWRTRYTAGGNDYQLITWSRDRTLRLWAIEEDMIAKLRKQDQHPASEKKDATEALSRGRRRATTAPSKFLSFREPPPTSPISDNSLNAHLPPLLPPVGNRTILGEVRAARAVSNATPVLLNTEHATESETHPSVKAMTTGDEVSSAKTSTAGSTSRIGRKAVTMSKGGKSASRNAMDQLTWLTSVRVGDMRGENSSMSASLEDRADESRSRSRDVSMSRARPYNVLGGFGIGNDPISPGHRSGSALGSSKDEPIDTTQHLQMEVTEVLSELSTHRIALEHFDLSRTCTLGIQAPWGEPSRGESAWAFLRVTFTFPPSYPYSKSHSADPKIDIERTPLIAPTTRAYLLRTLKSIRRQRPCLLECLSFLLGLGAQNRNFSDSSDDEAPPGRSSEEDVRFLRFARGNQNVPEFRTMQGMLGPNGEIVCYRDPARRIFGTRAPHRPTHIPNAQPDAKISTDTIPSSGVLQGAIFRLSESAYGKSAGFKPKNSSEDVMRVMDLINWKKRPARTAKVSRTGEIGGAYGTGSMASKSTLYVRNVSHLISAERVTAQHYRLDGISPLDMCNSNAELAKTFGREDHRRIFRLFGPLLSTFDQASQTVRYPQLIKGKHMTALMVIEIYRELCGSKDVQLLGMVSFLLIKFNFFVSHHSQRGNATHDQQAMNIDYFNHHQPVKQSGLRPWGKATRTPHSPSAPQSFSSSLSSHGSWSNFLGAGGIKLFKGGSGDKGLPHQNQLSPGNLNPNALIPKLTPQPPELKLSAKPVLSKNRRPTFSQVLAPRTGVTVSTKSIKPDLQLDTSYASTLTRELAVLEQMEQQCTQHIKAYAEVLLRWGLPYKRAELLACLSREADAWLQESTLDVITSHEDCKLQGNGDKCSHACKPGSTVTVTCSLCCLSIKGMSHLCILCGHAAHLTCSQSQAFCLTGCGCNCQAFVCS